MSGILGLFSGGNASQGLASLANVASRPNFELQFNQLQNTVIERLNVKIQEAQDAQKNAHVDAFLTLEQHKLQRMDGFVQKVRTDLAHNGYAISDLQNKVESLYKLAGGNGNAVDAAGFDKLLAQLNTQADSLAATDTVTSTAAGLAVDDGVGALKKKGVVRFDDGTGAKKMTKLADFPGATDAERAKYARMALEDGVVAGALMPDGTTALKAQTGALSRLVDVAARVSNRATAANGVAESTSKSLAAVSMQIEAAKSADQAEKAAEIVKLKQQYSDMLNTVSQAFEFQSAVNNAMFSPSELPAGSIASLFA